MADCKSIRLCSCINIQYDDINALIGKRLTFSEESAACFGDRVEYINNTAVNPAYQISVLSRSDFETNNRVVAFDKLGIKGDSIVQVVAADAKGNGSIFFIKDQNTLILSGGVYLELSRVEN